jgi:hypothetical protein
MKVAEYVTALYEFHFPWLTEFRDMESEFDYVGQEAGDESKSDPVHGFLSADEWETLTTIERNQRAGRPAAYPCDSKSLNHALGPPGGA